VPLAKLSQSFYEKFGHDLVEELVTWLNEMDSGNRSELRELNEFNFARFDAKLEQRAAQLDAKLEQRTAQLDAKIDRVAAELRAAVEAQTAILVKWMLGFWVMTVPTLAAVVVAVQHFLPARP